MEKKSNFVRAEIIDSTYDSSTREEHAFFRMGGKNGKEFKAIRLYEGMDRDLYFDIKGPSAFYVTYDEDFNLVAEMLDTSAISFTAFSSELESKKSLSTIIPFDGVGLQNGAKAKYEFYGSQIWFTACSRFIETYGWSVPKTAEIFKISVDDDCFYFVKADGEMFFVEI